MAKMKYVEIGGITYQVRADRPLPWWAKGAEDVTPAEDAEPEAKGAEGPANKSRRPARSKAVADG